MASILMCLLEIIKLIKMRIYILFLSVFSVLYACNSTSKTAEKSDIVSTNATQDTIRIANDELEYEVIIFELGFNNWLVTQPRISYYTDSYLAPRNRLNVGEWNNRVRNPGRYSPDLYMNLIDYNYNIDYGKEVNYMLFMYFKYFQEKYKQNLYI